MSSIVSLDNNVGVVEVDGDLTLTSAASLKSLFVKSLITADDVRVRFGEVGEVDMSFLQLMCSAHRSALRLSKHFSLEGGTPQALRDAMDAAGYTRLKGCKLDSDCSCIWMKLSGVDHV